MKLHFLGANRQVTGSRYCLETNRSRVLIDCGMFQERQYRVRNWRDSPIAPDTLHAVLLTHAHIDHCGLLPRLVRQGFTGPIYATPPSVDLVEVMLRDAAHIQQEDVEYKIRRHRREGRTDTTPPQPLFDDRDVDKTLPMLHAVPYRRSTRLTEDIEVSFREAGHILGSAMLEVTATENGQARKIIFSGDIGQWDKPLIHDPSLFHTADYIVMESTYGDRYHEEGGGIVEQLEAVINGTARAGGNVVIPTFAVERAQELIYYIGGLVHEKRIPSMPIYLDSPMAVDVTEIFRRHRDRYDEEMWEAIQRGARPLDFPGLQLCRSVQQSKAINETREPCIIMSTSGMCTAGRIKHHLKRELPRPASTVLFVGYQAHGTLGRQIVDGKDKVRIHGKMRPVRAKVNRIYGFSGHADLPQLLRWLDAYQQAPRQIFLTHGDEEAAINLADEIRNRHGWNVLIPDYESTSDL